MTYCLGLALNQGLVFASDSRTNAGVDNVSTYRKMHTFVWEGERVLVLLSAGNLATTQMVVRRLELDAQPEEHHRTNLRSVAHVNEAAAYVGRVSRAIQNELSGMQQGEFNASATFILGGQIGGQPPELYLIYPEGNFIGYSPERPFLQIGEVKYGKPILDRIVRSATSLEDAARCALVSLDSTMRSNLSAGPPVDLLIYRRDALKIERQVRFKQTDPYLSALRKQWAKGLREAFGKLPAFNWESGGSPE